MNKNIYMSELLYSQLDYIQNQIDEIKRQLSELDIKMNLKGSIFFKYVKCGKPKCRCATGEKHGPYPHLQWWDGQRIKTKYLSEKKYPIYKEELEKNKLKEKLERDLVLLEKKEKRLKATYENIISKI
jgi:hypothetical protein